MSATLRVVVGTISGRDSGTTLKIGGAYVDIKGSAHPQFNFNSNDEMLFAQSFKHALIVHRLFTNVDLLPTDAAAATGEPSIPAMTLQFTSSDRYVANYTLDVTFNIDGGKSIARTYHIDSTEGDSIWQIMNTSTLSGKRKAATKLLNKLIPDVETWILGNSSATENPNTVPTERATPDANHVGGE